MKSNIFKYLFILIAIVLVCYAIYKFKVEEKEDTNAIDQSQEIVREINLGVAQYDSINPYVTTNKNMQEILNIIYPGPVVLTSNFKPEFLLIDSIEKKEDGYLLRLKDNLKFSDDSNVKVEDIIGSLEIAKTSSNIFSDIVSNIESIEEYGEKELFVKLVNDDNLVEYYLTFPIVKTSTYKEDPVPIGIGSFYISDYDDSNFYLKPNTNYLGEISDANLEKINIIKYDNLTEMYNKFKLGNIDVISTNNNNVKDFIGKIGYNEKQVSDREHAFLAFNTTSPIFSNLEMRKAIGFAIDKENIISQTCQNNVISSSYPLDYGTWLCQENSVSSGYNVQLTQEILASQGYTIYNKKYSKVENWKRQYLTIKILVNADNALMDSVANNIKGQLENLGITVNLVQLPFGQYQDMLNNRDYDIALCQTYMTYVPSMNMFFGENNLAQYTSEQLTNTLNSLKDTKDENEKINLNSVLCNIYLQEIPYISLFNTKKTVVYNQNVNGNLAPNWLNPFNNVHTWSK